MKRVASIVCLVAACLLLTHAAFGQASFVRGGLTIIVFDPDGKAVAGASVQITDRGTGIKSEPVKTGTDGHISIGNLDPGKYDVTVTAPNFKTANYQDVEVVVDRVYDLTVKLELGVVTSEITVNAGGQEVLETTDTAIQTTISGRSITQLPLTSHQGTLLGVLDPGAQTQGGARNTVFEGLPRVATNITFDGINVMDNELKSSCGFFAMLDARIDDVEQFGITTAAANPDKTAGGGVTIAYVSKRGQNAWHGGAWEYNRNTDYNANYFMNNLFQSPRTVIDLNEFGGKAGGHILKDKLFIFGDVDYFQLPVKGFTTSATILNPGATAAGNGFYSYVPTLAPTSLTPNAWTTCTSLTTSATCTVNLMSGPNSLAATTHNPTAFDATVAAEEAILETAPSGQGVIGVTASGLNSESVSFGFNPYAHSVVPDGRIDYQANKNNSIELDYHYLFNDRRPDFLNGFEQLYPVAPYNGNFGSNISNRNLFVMAWTWNVASNMSNQIRIGVQSAPTEFGPDIQFTKANGYQFINTGYGTTQAGATLSLNGFTTPTLGFGDDQGRNVALGEAHDTFTWSHGAHSFSFGYDQSDVHGVLYNDNGGSIGTGLASQDPVITSGMFTEGAGFSGNLPGMGSSDLSTIEGLYGSFIGHVTSWSDSGAAAFRPNAVVNGGNPGFVTGASTVVKLNQNEVGFWGADSWRVRNGLTFNYGLRWEYQGPPNDPWGEYFANGGGQGGSVMSQYGEIWGSSGIGNLFSPGAAAGTPFSITGTPENFTVNPGITFQNDKNYKWWNKYYRGFAPSVGFAYEPHMDNKIAKAIFGPQGKSVLRAGYAISYGRDGQSPLQGITEFDGGNTASQSASAGSITNSTLSEFTAGSITVNQLANGTTMPGVNETPSQFVTTLPVQTFGSDGSVASFAPNLKPPMIMSYSVGFQRELSPNMVLEIRYTGNHGEGLWREVNINETNIFENGFLSEFNNAVNNLNLCNNNTAACLVAEQDAGAAAQTATKYTADFANLYAAAASGCAANPTQASCSSATSLAPLAGDVSLPIFTASISGTTRNSGPCGVGGCNVTPATLAADETAYQFQSSANFRNGTYVTDLTDGFAGSLASTLAGSTTFFPALVLAGYPGNFWRVNPADEFQGAYVLCNCSQSTYNAGIVDFRRRPSHGVQFDVSYTYSKGLTNNYTGSTSTASWTTLRDTAFDRGPSPYNLTHMIKSQLIWDLPFGAGKKWSSSSSIVNHIIGGWSFNAITRWQTGPPVEITSGLGDTFNGSDPGIFLNGITTGQLQSMLAINETEGGVGPGSTPSTKWVYYVPASLLDANLQRANTSLQSGTAPFQDCSVAGTLCSRIFVYGPDFFKGDWSIVKTTQITERVNIEIRMEALNVTNTPDFGWCAFSQATASGCSVSTQSTSFGRTGLGTRNGAAYYDFNTTWDPGGRNLQLVGRVNF